MYSQTLAPAKLAVAASTNYAHAYRNHAMAVAASQQMLAKMPLTGKFPPLYQTKLNYLGKKDSAVASLSPNSIHHSLNSTPKIAGFTKALGRVHLHYHHPSFGMVPISTTTKRNPIHS